ncbi:hypothetical protein [Candidatus Enterovibrio escicola]|uniref:hypothetical protein n=1 Tax=Candidatus Enterovibrio escicola TaxID=1927127 RepID=UPI001237C1D5
MHIILEGAGDHRSDLVIDEHSFSILSFTLYMPYSSNLNSIERFWKVMNERSRNNGYFKITAIIKRLLTNLLLQLF